jgi:hypothetical protein
MVIETYFRTMRRYKHADLPILSSLQHINSNFIQLTIQNLYLPFRAACLFPFFFSIFLYCEIATGGPIESLSRTVA